MPASQTASLCHQRAPERGQVGPHAQGAERGGSAPQVGVQVLGVWVSGPQFQVVGLHPHFAPPALLAFCVFTSCGWPGDWVRELGSCPYEEKGCLPGSWLLKRHCDEPI